MCTNEEVCNISLPLTWVIHTLQKMAQYQGAKNDTESYVRKINIQKGTQLSKCF
jgi:hypothetical protein